jgi:hypothetical protein
MRMDWDRGRGTQLLTLASLGEEGHEVAKDLSAWSK